MGEESSKSDDGVTCEELSPGLWKVSVRFSRGRLPSPRRIQL